MCTNNIYTEIKETYIEIYLNMSIGFASFNNQYCHYIVNCLYLHGSYFTNFDFMNYLLLSCYLRGRNTEFTYQIKVFTKARCIKSQTKIYVLCQKL